MSKEFKEKAEFMKEVVSVNLKKNSVKFINIKKANLVMESAIVIIMIIFKFNY